MFDWLQFLDRYGIEYTTSGKSTAKGNVYVQCPFCGAEDHGHHMGISTEGRGWGCWKYDDHRGKSPVRLIKALAGISHVEALALVGNTREVVSSASLKDRLVEMLSPPASQAPKYHPLKMPASFKPLDKRSLHHEYMRRRGFFSDQIAWLTETFDLRECLLRPDDWAYRVIVPVYSASGRLLTWTGRAATKSHLRYKTLSTKTPDASGLLANEPLTNCFLRPDELLEGGKFLVLVEGPFDAMRLALEEHRYEAKVTCLFGKNVSDAQMDVLSRCRDKYDRVFLALDSGEVASTLKMTSRLPWLGVEPIFLEGAKDPGDFTDYEACYFLEELARR